MEVPLLEQHMAKQKIPVVVSGTFPLLDTYFCTPITLLQMRCNMRAFSAMGWVVLPHSIKGSEFYRSLNAFIYPCMADFAGLGVLICLGMVLCVCRGGGGAIRFL